MNICIFGASSRKLDQAHYDAAYEFGTLAARAGHTVIFGGGQEGVMGAAARGVHDAGGRLIAIVPAYFNEPGVLFEGCDERIFTPTMRDRKARMEELSDAFAALPGGIGTYEELFEMLTLKQLGRHGKAIALLNTLGCWEPLLSLLNTAVKDGFVSAGVLELLTVCDTPSELLSAIESYVPTTGDLRRLEDYCK